MKLENLMFLGLAISCWTVSSAHSQIDGDVRLTGFGANPYRGKLEIFYNGHWGTVCAPYTLISFGKIFETNAANVVCRQLGLGFAINYYTGDYLPELVDTYGSSTGPIHLDMVECDGSEPHLLRCGHSGLGEARSSCTHMDDVTVECSDIHVPYSGEVRLSDVSSGTLELYSTGHWNGVCFEDNFGQSQATAVCRQLGYTGASSYRQLSSADYSGDYWDLGGVALSNTTGPCFTASLSRLPLTTRSTSCSPVYVQCEYTSGDVASGNADLCTLNTSTPVEGDVRLTGSSSPSSEGTVEVYTGGMWGSVCGTTGFGFSEADVICKQLRHPRAIGTIGPSGLSSGPVYGLSCSGIEDNVGDCSLRTLDPSGCSQGAYITCGTHALTPYGELTFRGGAGTTGFLYFFSGSDFRPICNSNFGMTEANVACKQLGYERAVTVRSNSNLEVPTSIDVSSSLIFFSRECLGNESHLLECGSSQEPQGMCRDGLDLVELQCAPTSPPALRLVGGHNSSSGRPISGRLEISFGDSWGTIAGSKFSHLSAHVACNQLGFATAQEVFNSSRFNAGSGVVVLDDVQCSGGESSLLDCPSSVVVNNSRSHDQDVGIECSEELAFPEGTLRLLDGSNSSSGRLEIFKLGVWMSVCGETFSFEAASMACTQLGFADLATYCTNSCFGEGTGFIHSMDDTCVRGEGSLFECGGVVTSDSECNHSTTVGLVCVPHEPTTDTPTTTPPVTTVTTQRTVSSVSTTSSSTGIENSTLYIIVAVVGLAVIVIVGVVIGLVCCLCCCVARRRRKMMNEGTWRTSVQSNGHTANGLHSHNGHANGTRWPHVDTSTKITSEKVGDYDDPRTSLEMNGFANSTPSVKTDSDPNLDYKAELSLELEQGHHHYENLPRRSNAAISNTLYVEESASPASPPPGYDELEFLPHSRT